MMSTRKIIQFGKSSFVISLPNTWVKLNHVKKGDELVIEEKPSSLVVSLNKKNKEEATIKKMDIDNLTRSLKMEIYSSYINNYNLIELHGKKVKEATQEIIEATHSLVAFEVVEQSANKIVIRDFLSTENVSIQSIIRRMDMIIRTMSSELMNEFEAGVYTNSFKNMDKDVNRLYHVGFKLLNKLINQPSREKELNFKLSDVLFFQVVIDALEKIADQQKRIQNILYESKIKPDKKFISLYKEINEEYLKSVKCLYALCRDDADQIMHNRKKILAKCNDLIKTYISTSKEVDKAISMTQLINKFMRFENYQVYISKAVLFRDSPGKELFEKI